MTATHSRTGERTGADARIRAASGRARRKRAGPDVFALFWAAPLALWQAAFFVVPLAFIVVMTFWSVEMFQITRDFTFDNWARVYTRDFFWSALGRSFTAAGLAAVITSVLAFPCAYTLALKVSTRARLIGACLLITPFFTSYIIRSYTWRTMLGENGIVNAFLGYLDLGPFIMVNNLFGMVIGYMTLLFPLVLILQLLSLSFVDRRLIEAAHNLGCGRIRTVFLVVIPAARIGLILAMAFAFVLSFGDFISPTVLGGSSPPTLSLLIVDQVRAGNHWPRASVIAVTMIAILLSVVALAMTAAYKSGGGRK